MATGAIIARILTQYSDKGSKAAQKDIAKLGKSFDAVQGKAMKAFGLAATASAAFAIKIGKDAVQSAIADQKQQAILANSLRNTTGATESAIAGVESYIASLQKQFSVLNDDLRPAMATLTAVTKSTTAAQTLMQTALDISADKGVDLSTAVGAIVRATRGQYKALSVLVPGLDAATLATKDFGKITDKVSKLTAGAAAKRAQTMEYRIKGLKIAFDNIVQSLGYALLPVVKEFADILSQKVLPQLENFISTNKDKLVASFQLAADYGIKFLNVALAIASWASNNVGLFQVIAGIFATMFVLNGISKLILGIEAINTAMKVLRATSIGTAIAMALATRGVSVGMGLTALAGIGVTGLVTKNLFDLIKGDKGKTGPTDNAANHGFDSNWGKGTSIGTVGGGDAYQAFIDSLNKNTKATVADTKAKMDAITKEAVRLNLERQKTMSGSTSLAIGQGGKIYGPRNANGTVINVNAGAVVGSQDALVQAVKTGLTASNKRSGISLNGSGNFNGMGSLLVP